MPHFTIETTYQLPVFRHRTYEADTFADACRLAIEDEDWSEQEEDYDCARETYVTGAWSGEVRPYSVANLSIPAHFGDTLQRKADHLEVLLGILKVLAPTSEGGSADAQLWRRRADAAIAKAEAIIAGARDPGIDGDAP